MRHHRIFWFFVVVALLLVAFGSVFLLGRQSVNRSTTTTFEVQPASWTAIWPLETLGVRYSSPGAAAKGFAVAFLHMVRPLVEPFQQGDTRSGEVAIRPYANGPVTTVLVRQLTSDNSWWVLGCINSSINISEPNALDLVASPLKISGFSTANEAVVNVSLRQDNFKSSLASTTVMGGSMGQMGPFVKTLLFETPSSNYGALVMYTLSAKDGSVMGASVIRLRYR